MAEMYNSVETVETAFSDSINNGGNDSIYVFEVAFAHSNESKARVYILADTESEALHCVKNNPNIILIMKGPFEVNVTDL